MTVSRPATEMSAQQVALELAGYIAPALRCVTAEASRRPVKLVKNGTWEVTGEATLGEGLRGLAKIHDLEHTPAEGRRPAEALCLVCAHVIKVVKHAPIRKVCDKCLRPPCAKCGGATGARSGSMRQRSLRKGAPAMCQKCNPRHPHVTSCKHGHPLTDDNVYVAPKTGFRTCIKCRRNSNNKRRRRDSAPGDAC